MVGRDHAGVSDFEIFVFHKIQKSLRINLSAARLENRFFKVSVLLAIESVSNEPKLALTLKTSEKINTSCPHVATMSARKGGLTLIRIQKAE